MARKEHDRPLEDPREVNPRRRYRASDESGHREHHDGVHSEFSDTPTDSGAYANRTQPHRNPSRGTVGAGYTDPGHEPGAESARGIPQRNPSRGTVGSSKYVDPGSGGTGSEHAHRGTRNSPAMDMREPESEGSMSGSELPHDHEHIGMTEAELERGFKPLPMPGADTNSPDMPVKSWEE